VLAGTGPRGGPDLHRWTDDVCTNACADEITGDTALNVFLSGSEDSRAKGMEHLERTQRRQAHRDARTDLATRDAQLALIAAWGIPDASKLNRLAGISQSTFVAVGDNDTMMHTKNSQLLTDRLPNAHLRIYPGSLRVTVTGTRVKMRGARQRVLAGGLGAHRQTGSRRQRIYHDKIRILCRHGRFRSHGAGGNAVGHGGGRPLSM
jgi:hypothetical protein